MSLGQEDEEVRQRCCLCQIHECIFNLSLSVLGLRLFGQDTTTEGQSQSETYRRRHHPGTPVEHAPVHDEDKKPTLIIEEYVPGETEDSKT